MCVCVCVCVKVYVATYHGKKVAVKKLTSTSFQRKLLADFVHELQIIRCVCVYV